jgi:hypothetical protein
VRFSCNLPIFITAHSEEAERRPSAASASGAMEHERSHGARRRGRERLPLLYDGRSWRESGLERSPACERRRGRGRRWAEEAGWTPDVEERIDESVIFSNMSPTKLRYSCQKMHH